MITNPHFSIFKGEALRKKIEKNDDYKDLEQKYSNWAEDTKKQCDKIANKYIKNTLSSNDMDNVSKSLSTYIEYCFKLAEKYSVSSQTKFLSSIMEEFLIMLFDSFINKKYPNLGLKCASECCIISSCIEDPIKNTILFEKKNIDCAIYKSQSANNQNINIPLIGIEIKTYIDKTMSDSIEFTRERLEKSNPSALYVGVAELEALSKDKIKFNKRLNKDNYFVLRNQRRLDLSECYRHDKTKMNPISPSILFKMYNNIANHMDRIT